MLITDQTWQRIRSQFDDTEKAALNNAVAGSCICPRGLVLEDSRMPPELLAKLKAAKEGPQK